MHFTQCEISTSRAQNDFCDFCVFFFNLTYRSFGFFSVDFLNSNIGTARYTRYAKTKKQNEADVDFMIKHK